MTQSPDDLCATTNPNAEGYAPVGSKTLTEQIRDFISRECTFYRVHLTAFVFIPLIASGILYASSGRFNVKYIDALFLCYSAMTVTGLATVNLSTLTPWQQVMVYFLMVAGDITIISWIVVLVRKRFLRNHCEYVLETRRKRKKPLPSRSELLESIAAPQWIPYNPTTPGPQSAPVGQTIIVHDPNTDTATESAPPLITTIAPTLGQIHFVADPSQMPSTSTASIFNQRRTLESWDGPAESGDNVLISDDHGRWTSSPTYTSPVYLPSASSNTQHVDFASSTGAPTRDEELYRVFGPSVDRIPLPGRTLTITSTRRRENTTLPNAHHLTDASQSNRRYRGLGEFPGPVQIIQNVAKRAAPKAFRKFERSMTMPSSRTLESRNTPYLDFNLRTSRNSDFHTETLSEHELEKLGGTEYRALKWLTWVVPLYFVGSQVLAFTIFAPWFSISKKYDAVFENQYRLVNKNWFSLFQVMSAYTGGGLSLVDLGMIPFQTAYLMIFPLMFAIIAGNHALPIFLRFVIWVLSKMVREETDAHAALSFLLDHPRRCFLYLFPSHQTWFLLFSLVLFNAIEWIGFLVLNNGLSAYDSLPVAVRVVGGLFQGVAVRASGFPIFPLSSLAPSLLFLYVVMMYIAVYPIAMSIRSTNVYEERSLGVYELRPMDEYFEPQGLEKIKNRRERIGKYFYWHFRRQMSIDIWWLVWAVFFIAIVERDNLMDPNKKWFDLFRILFELVSAFGGIGLSLGFPDDNFSFAGAMRPLSKLIVIVIMVRGRHRGLPVALDRAIVLPTEMVTQSQRVGSPTALNEKPQTTQNPQPLYSDFGA